MLSEGRKRERREEDEKKEGNKDKQDYDRTEVSRQRNMTNRGKKKKSTHQKSRGIFPPSARVMVTLNCLITKGHVCGKREVMIGFIKHFLNNELAFLNIFGAHVKVDHL